MFAVYVNVRYWASDNVPRWVECSEVPRYPTKREAENARNRHIRTCIRYFGAAHANPRHAFKVFEVK